MGATPSGETCAEMGVVGKVQCGGSCELKGIQRRWWVGCFGGKRPALIGRGQSCWHLCH